MVAIGLESTMTNTRKQAKMLTFIVIAFLLTMGAPVDTLEDSSATPNTQPGTNVGVDTNNENVATTVAGDIMAPGVGTGVSDSSSVVSGTNTGGGGQRSSSEMPQGTGVGGGGGGELGVNPALTDGSNSDSMSPATSSSSFTSDGGRPSGSTATLNINKIGEGNLAAEVTTKPSNNVPTVADSTQNEDNLDSIDNNPRKPTNKTSASPGGVTSDGWSPVPMEELVDRQQLVVLYRMANGFLDMIQPRYISDLKDFLDFQNPGEISEELYKNIPTVLLYFLGFLICIGIGVLLMLCVPFVGSIVCCCRCCGKCGGKVDKRDKKISECSRCCCGFLLFTFLAFVLTGGVIMVALSADIHARLTGDESVFDDISKGINTLADYGNQTLNEMGSATLEKYQVANQQAFSSLEAILPDVTQQLGAEPYLNDLVTFSGSLDEMSATRNNISNLKSKYLNSKSTADQEIRAIKTDALRIIGSCCPEAKDSITKLATKADFSGINTLRFYQVIEGAIAGGMEREVNEAHVDYTKEINKANDTINSEIIIAKDGSRDIENRIKSFIDDVRDVIQTTDIQNISKTVEQIKVDGTQGNIPYLKIPGWSLLALAILVLILAVCYYFGLAFGTMCKRPRQQKSQCCTWKTGACWLLIGIALTFIFYLFLMLVLIVLFTTGGAVHTEACRHLYNLPDSPIAGMVNRAFQTNFKNFSVNVSESYRDCALNKPMYTAFKLEENGINLTKIFNAIDISKAMEKVKNIQITVGPFNPFTEEEKNKTVELGEEMDNFIYKFEEWLKMTEVEVLTEPLSEVVRKLKEAAPNTTDSDGLIQQAEKLENLTVIDTMEEQKQELQGAIQELIQLVSRVNLTLTLTGLFERLDVINENGTVITQGIVNRTADDVMVVITDTINDVEEDVRFNVGKCGPLYTSMSSMINSGCVSLLYSLNAYWFCMGMVLIPIIFVVITAFKLVGLYRKTEPHSALEAIDNHLYMSAFQEQDHRARSPSKKDQEMLLKPMNRGRSDYLAMADNPVFQDDELPYAIPRAVLRTGRPVLPVHPADPDDAYYYAMPRRSPPPKYSTSSTGF